MNTKPDSRPFAFFPIVAVALFVSFSTHGSPPSIACAWEDADPFLDANDANVVSSDTILHHKGMNYKSQIRGMAEVDFTASGPNYRICRRYEFSNLSKDVIKEFRWPDVKIGPVSEVSPGESMRWSKPFIHSRTDIREDITTIYAWENSETTGVTIFPAKVDPIKLTSFPAEPGKMYAANAPEYVDAVNQNQPKGMFVEASYSFYNPAESLMLPSLMTGFSSQSVNLSVDSYARFVPRENHVASHVILRYDWTRDGDATLYAPGMAALEKLGYGPESNPRKTTSDLTELVPGMEAFPVASGEKTIFDLSYQVSAENTEPALYVVEQPVTLRVGDWSACVLVLIYSPVPISFEPAVHCQSIR